MSQADVSGSERYVVSASTVLDRRASQLYFAGLLSQRPLVGGSLGLALRRLRTIVGPEEFDHLRVARYPHPRAVDALRCSPLLAALTPLRRRGVTNLRASLASVTRAPEDWREVRAAWVLADRDPAHAHTLLASLTEHPELGAFCAFEASLSALPAHPLGVASAPALKARTLTVLAFPSVRLALDALALPRVSAFLESTPSLRGPSRELAWALMERVSLREMLTPG